MAKFQTSLTSQNVIKNLWRAVFWVSFPFGVLNFLLPIYGKELGSALDSLAGEWLYDNVGKALPFYLNTAVLMLVALLVTLVLNEPGK